MLGQWMNTPARSSSTPKGSVTLRPARKSTRLRRERGVPVFLRGTKLTAAATDRVLRALRKKGDRENFEKRFPVA